MTIAELTRQAEADKEQRWAEVERAKHFQQKPRSLKSRRSHKPEPNSIGNGYDQLPEPHLSYYNVALPFARGIPAQDSEDLLHTIILTLVRANGHKPLSEAAMYRIASRTKADYWRAHYKHTNGLDCGHCSNQQRRKCRKDWLYRECPKAIWIERLSRPVTDADGNMTELGDLIADDHALDIPQWLDNKTFLLGCQDRLLGIAGKIQDGEALTESERQYISRFRRQAQTSLF